MHVFSCIVEITMATAMITMFRAWRKIAILIDVEQFSHNCKFSYPEMEREVPDKMTTSPMIEDWELDVLGTLYFRINISVS